MTGILPGLERPLARKKPDPPPTPEGRDRIDLRADPALIVRIQRQATRHGLSISAYIRLAVTRLLEHDEGTDPELAD